MGMSTDLEPDFVKLRALSSSIAELRATVSKLEGLRDDLVREMRAAGRSAIAIADVASLNRSRVYQILEAPGPEAEDWDHHEFAEHFAELWDGAVNEWMAADDMDETVPDDYFPLERLVERR